MANRLRPPHLGIAVLGAAMVLAATLAIVLAQKPDPAAREWIHLFNGRDLANWTIKFAKHDLGENVRNTFRVEDGLLKVRYDQQSALRW